MLGCVAEFVGNGAALLFFPVHTCSPVAPPRKSWSGFELLEVGTTKAKALERLSSKHTQFMLASCVARLWVLKMKELNLVFDITAIDLHCSNQPYSEHPVPKITSCRQQPYGIRRFW